MKKVIETERLLLRPFTAEDIEPSYQMNLDPQVSRYTMDGGVQPREAIEKRILESVLGDYAKYGFGRFAVVFKPDQCFIGFAGLKYLDSPERPYHGQVDLGYRLAREYWGRGIATEASHASLDYGFNDLQLETIIALAHADNLASIQIMKKLGMSFQQAISEDGQPVVWYAIDRQPFQAEIEA